ncbi:MAG TPA: M36 family metallopeptidase [Blastocatellia bacterium]|nr:M36 family metallopeptidase [Blastocatellia bacterium]HMY70515.1 M36 family metallopeptidase [Blastocatellia bacterium]HNG30552.1 M36 family metallopeptidase [Blastocatellia bacterium]
MNNKTRSLVALITVLCIFSLVLSVAAQRQPQRSSAQANPQDPRRPRRQDDFDIRANLSRTLPADSESLKLTEVQGRTLVAARDSRLHRERPSAQLQFSNLTGAPSRVYSFTQELTASGGDADASARQFLKRNDDLFRLQAAEVDNLRTSRRYRTDHNGVTHLTLQQQVNGIDVFQGDYSFHFDRAGALLAGGGELIPLAANLTNASRPRLNVSAALRKAAGYADLELTGESSINAAAAGREQRQRLAHSKFEREVDARLVYFPLTGNQLRLAWEFRMWLTETPDVYLMVVDAEDGALLYRDNETWYCFDESAPRAVASGSAPISNPGSQSSNRSLPFAAQTQPNPHGLVFTGESPRPNWPFVTNNPQIVQREDLPFRGTPFNGTTIYPAGDPHNDWWAGASPTTFTSNNADAYLDRNANNQPDDSPRLSFPDSNFSFPIDFNQQPTTEDNQKSALANLFYWTNRYHDILYLFGFNEAAGNYQVNNFGRGGQGGDLIRAEAQDGSGTDNANFSPSVDGSPGRMQMYLFTGGAIQRDGDLDQGIILHELTHGTSTRLVRSLSGLQGGGMGEGWSDYIGLALLLKEGDNLDGTYAVGGYALNDFVNGVRRFPYSTSTTVYPYSFGDIARNTEVHAVGEIWCNALMEVRAQLIRKLGFKEGQRQSIQLVIDGMKMTSPAPSFLDARNGIMLADKVNNGGANQCTMWQAFAKRGLGFSATTLDARDGIPQQDFDLPPFCSPLGNIRFNQKAYLLGETVQIALGDQNASGTVRVKVRSSVTGDEETLTLTADGTFAGSYTSSLRVVPGAATPGDGALQASLAARDKITVIYDDANNGSGAAAQVTAQADVAGEKNFFEDTVETGNLGWSVTGTPADTWAVTETRAASGTRSWTDSPNGNYVAGTNASLVSPLFDLSRAAGVTLTFAHTYALTSGFDYGIVEFSLDDGASWKRAAAFTGTQSSFIQAQLKLDALAGQAKARIRFRLNSNVTTTSDGWTIDDIRIIARSSDPTFIPPPSRLAPMLTGVSPAFGPPAGNTTVNISGLNFTETGDVRVFFNGVAATNVRALGSTSLTAVTPAQSAGKASIRIETRYGVQTLANAFTYYVNGSVTTAPDVVSLTPAGGSVRGGATVTISGANFSPETTVLFGAQTATRTFINANTLRVIAPAAAATGAVDVTVRNSATAEKKLTGAFNYTAPTPPLVKVLSPNGGEQVFTGATVSLRWQSSDNTSVARHRIALYRSTNTTPQLVANIAEVGGEAQSFNWTIPTAVAGANARLRVLAIDDENAETEAFSSADFTIATRWQAMTQLPAALNRVPTANDGKYIYTLAGRTTTANSSSVTTVQRLDPAAASPAWEPLSAIPTAFNSGKAVAVNGKIYIPGGITPTAAIERNLYVYDIAANTWATLPPPPTGVHAYSLVADAARNTLYLTGGSDGVVAGFTNVQAYDIAANKWTALPPLNTARFAHESVLANGKLYVAGGIGSAGGLVSGEVFDFSTQKWSPIDDLPRVHQYTVSAPAMDAGGRLLWLVIGGEDGNGAPIGNIDAYDFAANRWLTLDGSYNLPAARTRLGSTTLGGFVYAVGGIAAVTGGTAVSRTVERFKLDGFTILSPNQPPLMTVPLARQIALPNRELTFVVSAQDLGSGVPITITAEGLPSGASFAAVNETNNSARGTFKWTPAAADIGRSFNITFTANDGSLTDVKAVTVSVVQASQVAAVNAADFRNAPLAADSIAAAFGVNLAPRVEIAQSVPLPLALADTTLTVNGIPAPLFFVSPSQINFLIPAGVDPGSATLQVSTAQGNFALGTIQIVAAAPALFTANASGQGDAAAQATVDGVNFQSQPFDVTVNGKPNILVLYGTGFRRTPAANPTDANGVAEAVTVTIDGKPANVLYAGAQGSFAGLDQINVELPAGLAGQGPRRVEVLVSAAAVPANRVTIQIK